MLHKDVRYEKRALSNGVPVYFALSPHTSNLRVTLKLKAGGAHESPEERGIAHAMEHVLFLGAGNSSREEMENAPQQWLGNQNALTGMETIRFYCNNSQGTYSSTTAQFQDVSSSDSLCNHHAALMVKHIADMVLRPHFPEADTRNELNIIANEVGWSHDNRELSHLWNFVIPQIQTSPFHKNVTGSKEEVRAITIDGLRGFLDRHLTAGKVSLYVTGHELVIDDVMSEMEREFGSLTRGEAMPSLTVVLKPADLRVTLLEKMQNYAHIFFLMPPPKDLRDLFVFQTAMDICSSVSNDRIRREIGSSYTYVPSIAYVDSRTRLISLAAHPDPLETSACMKAFTRNFMETPDYITQQRFQSSLNGLVYYRSDTSFLDADTIYDQVSNCVDEWGGMETHAKGVDMAASIAYEDVVSCARQLYVDPVATVCVGPKPETMPKLAEIRALVGARPQAIPRIPAQRP